MGRVRLNKKDWLDSMKKKRETDLNKEILASGLNQSQLGETLGISQQTFSYRLKHHKFSYSDFCLLCFCLDLTDDEIVRLVRIPRERR